MYLSAEERAALGVYTTGERTQPTLPGVEEQVTATDQGHDLPPDPPSIPSPAQLMAQLDFSAGAAPTEPAASARSGALDAPFCIDLRRSHAPGRLVLRVRPLRRHQRLQLTRGRAAPTTRRLTPRLARRGSSCVAGSS